MTLLYRFCLANSASRPYDTPQAAFVDSMAVKCCARRWPARNIPAGHLSFKPTSQPTSQYHSTDYVFYFQDLANHPLRVPSPQPRKIFDCYDCSLLYSVLRLLSQPTQLTPILPSKMAPGAGIVLVLRLSIANRLACCSLKSMTARLTGVPLYENLSSDQ